MPGILTELHVASALSELNAKSELPENLKLKPKLLVKTLEKIYNDGNERKKLGDEEMAYIYYMKVLNMHTAIKKSKEYLMDKKFFDAMTNRSIIVDALDNAESISKSLEQRYKEREAKLAAEKEKKAEVAAVEVTADVLDDPFTFPTSNGIDKTVEAPKTSNKLELSPSISVTELYGLLTSSGDSPPLIIDARSAEQFSESQIKYGLTELLSIPEELLSPGILPGILRSKLTARNRALFDARANYGRFVILDWDSTIDDLSLTSNAVGIIKNAIYKWDQQVKLASEPQILEGGYKEWLRYYPQHTTNSQVAGLQLPKAKIDIPDLDSISYNFDFADESDEETDPTPLILTKVAGVPPPAPSAPFPLVNRANKPNVVQSAGLSPAPQPRLQNGSQANVKPVAPAQPAPSEGGGQPRPSVNRNLKPQPSAQPVTTNGELSQKELEQKLSEQNRRIIAEASEKLVQISAEKAKLAALMQQTQMESAALAEIMRKKRVCEKELQAQEFKVNQAKQVQREHDSAIPQVNRNLKPNLDDWELRLQELTESDDSESRRTEADDGKSTEGSRREAGAKLAPDEQSKLIEQFNKQAKLHPTADELKRKAERERMAEHKRAEERKMAEEKARIAEEQRLAAEKEGIAEEQRKAAEKARNAEEQRMAAEKAKLAEQRLAAEKARNAEEQRVAAEKAKLAEQRLAAEKARNAEEQRKAAEKARAADEQRKAAEKARAAEEQRRAAEMAKIAEQKRANELSTNHLPSGWQKKLDSTGKPFYINYQTGEKTFTPPQVPAKPATPTRVGQGSPVSSRSTTRLKSDETTFGVNGEISSNMQTKSKMKKFNSIPNLTKLDDEGSASPSVTFDRSSKPVVKKPAESTRKFVRMDSRRLENFQPEYGVTTPGLTGLYNMGNTCYMNSALQCLSHTTLLCKYFKEDLFHDQVNEQSTKGTRGAISVEFAMLLKCLWAGNYRYIVPRDFKYVFGQKKVDFNHFKQMDSQEFLNTLLDTLHEDLNSEGHVRSEALPEIPSHLPDDQAARMAYEQYTKRNKSIIVNLFTGQQRSVVQCKHCKEKSNTFDTFTFLPLEIRTSYSTSLSKCLETYQRVDDAEGYKCEKCNRKQSTRRLELYRLPPVLIIFFKRFNQYSYQFSKKTNMIDFSEHLQLKGVGDAQSKHYQLYGVVNHFGSLDSGHYTSFCKSSMSGMWHKFNDENVSTVRSFSDVKSSAAYILFYTSTDRR